MVEAEKGLRSDVLEATIEYNDVTRPSACVRFDHGAEGEAARFHVTTSYEGAATTQIVERIIGEQFWQRQADGGWAMIAPQEGF